MEDIEIIEENKDMFFDTLYECYRQNAIKPFENAIDNLISSYKELEEEKEECIKALEEWVNGERLLVNSISKKKIENKVEELRTQMLNSEDLVTYEKLEYCYRTLKKLIED